MALVTGDGADDDEDVEEDVDDVEVEVEGGEDVVLGVDGQLVLAAHDQLRVEHQEQAEQERPHGAVRDVRISVRRKSTVFLRVGSICLIRMQDGPPPFSDRKLVRRGAT